MTSGAMAQDSAVRSQTPRQVVWHSSWHRNRVMFSRFLFFLFCAGTIAALVFLWQSVQWVEHGTNVWGRVIDKYETHGKGSGCHIRYTYTLNGNEETDSDVISRNLYDTLWMNSPVQVRVYGDVSWHSVRALDPKWNLWIKTVPSTVMALLAVVIAGLIYLDAYVWPARHRQLLTWGTATPAVITDRRDIKGKGSRTYLRYEFTMENGVHVQAKWSGSPLLRITPGIGDMVTVFHMPGQAKPNVVYEVCVYQISDNGQRV